VAAYLMAYRKLKDITMKVNFYRDELDDAEGQPHLFALLDKRERDNSYMVS
jgi:hypothetical protein